MNGDLQIKVFQESVNQIILKINEYVEKLSNSDSIRQRLKRIFIETIKLLCNWKYNGIEIINHLRQNGIIGNNEDDRMLIQNFLKFLLQEKILIWKDFKEKSTGKIRILHLSDLQIGKDIDEILLNNLISYLRNIKGEPLDFIFITGDATSQGKRKEFDRFIIFLNKLNSIFPRVRKSQVIIIPGNHDINQQMSSINESWKFRTYNSFLRSFYCKNIQENYFFSSFDINGYQIPIFALNSCIKITHNKSTFKNAIIDNDQICEVQSFFEKKNGLFGFDNDNLLLIYCMHHPPNNLKYFYDRILKRLFKKEGLHIVFHGHTHTLETPTILYTRKNKTILSIGSGSATTKVRKRIFETYSEPQFNIVTIDINNMNNDIPTCDIDIENHIIEDASDINPKRYILKWNKLDHSIKIEFIS